MYTLITNNADLADHVTSAEVVDGTPLEVLLRVRNLVHTGSIILTHPLCGNLHPNHQPYRSVLLDVRQGAADLESLTLIESAIRVYEAVPCAAGVSESSLRDYAYIDSELMRESLEQYRLIRDEELITASSLLMKEECK